MGSNIEFVSSRFSDVKCHQSGSVIQRGNQMTVMTVAMAG